MLISGLVPSSVAAVVKSTAAAEAARRPTPQTRVGNRAESIVENLDLSPRFAKQNSSNAFTELLRKLNQIFGIYNWVVSGLVGNAVVGSDEEKRRRWRRRRQRRRCLGYFKAHTCNTRGGLNCFLPPCIHKSRVKDD